MPRNRPRDVCGNFRLGDSGGPIRRHSGVTETGMECPGATVFRSWIRVIVGSALLVRQVTLSQPVGCILERLGRAGHDRQQEQGDEKASHPNLHGERLYTPNPQLCSNPEADAMATSAD